MDLGTAPAYAPERIARIERFAARWPRLYRFRLVALALIGDGLLTLIEVLPWFLPVGFGLLWYNHVVFYWIGAAVLVLLIWLVRPSVRDHGRELRRDEAPHLFADIDALRAKIDAPMRLRVFVDDDLNASAGERGGTFGVLPPRCALTLGLPLVAILSREQLLAVIAHELGHFSRRHGRFGHWVYRTRVSWLEFAETVEHSGSALDQAAAWYARRFVPYFGALSFVHSRACEFEADAVAASATSPRALADALATIAVAARIWHRELPGEIERLQLDHAEPPVDCLARFTAALRAEPAARVARRLAAAMALPSSGRDTHPGLGSRLAALSIAADQTLRGGLAQPSSSLHEWNPAMAECDARWRQRQQRSWRIEHVRLQHAVRPYLAMSAEQVSKLDTEERLFWARALRWLRPDEGLAALQSLHEKALGDPRVAFAYAAALLADDDANGLPHMEALAKSSATLRPAAYSRILQFHAARGDAQTAASWSIRVTNVYRRRAGDVEQVTNAAADGTGGESRAERGVTVLAEAARLDACVTQAFLFEDDAALSDRSGISPGQIRVHTLVLILDPRALEAEGQLDHEIRASYREAMIGVLPPDEHGSVVSYFSTEPLPEALKARTPILARDAPL